MTASRRRRPYGSTSQSSYGTGYAGQANSDSYSSSDYGSSSSSSSCDSGGSSSSVL